MNKKRRGSISASASITNRCNLRCKMCDAWRLDHDSSGLRQNWVASEKILTVNEWVAVIKNLGLNLIHFKGVEPLLYPEIEQLLAQTSRLCTVWLTTNGWLAEKYIDAIANSCHNVAISLDGRHEVHDRVRGRTGSFEKAFAACLELRRRFHKTNRTVRVSLAINPDNIQEINPLNRILRQHGIVLYANHFNMIHEESCQGLDCLPTNLIDYNLNDIDVEKLHQAIVGSKGVVWLPALKTMAEVRKYYRDIPLKRLKTKRGCKPMRRAVKGLSYCIAPDGELGIASRCWYQIRIGNALNPVTSFDMSKMRSILSDINSKGLPAPCQRLCCAGKAI